MAQAQSVPGQQAASPSERERRGHQRKPPRGRCVVHLFRGTFGLGRNLALELLDISLSGAKLRVSERFRPGEEVTLQFLGQGHLRPVKTLARVVWCRPENSAHILGVSFEKLLPYSDFLHIT
ncbi:MAG: PilZ domain-containing protein [Gemmatales bacterium]|nr:PilZ domain-containing protein [Gemmatales bacterium]MDW8223122.1 PilZ domain-containing protein [Gemmatales bacterium]